MKKYYGLKTKDVDMDIQETSNKSTNSNLIKIKFYKFYKGWTNDKIWDIISEEIHQVKAVVSKFKRWLKARNWANMKNLGKRKILQPMHQELIKNILSTSKNTIMTVSLFQISRKQTMKN